MAAPSLFALVMVALLVSSCGATARGAMSGEMVMHEHDDPVCEVMVPCNVLDCTQHCINVGLRQKGFCTAKPDLQFYCCCPVVSA
ncbi:uncharacterized protein C2845_PM12G30610 [Panicum miliaceum]|uniref:Uncharacterized protein n=1 Tax=Panicum miliaceum TaxID=4540 RepID=A0A3L6QJQ9_PANMI|nr:uncharacterized protein C2845_PM12G30610 [Panicum miliaceum]